MKRQVLVKWIHMSKCNVQSAFFRWKSQSQQMLLRENMELTYFENIAKFQEMEQMQREKRIIGNAFRAFKRYNNMHARKHFHHWRRIVMEQIM